MKGMIYETPVESEEYLLAWIITAADLELPGIHERVYQNMVRGTMSDAGMKWREKRGIPEKTRRQTASSGTIPTCENSVTRPGIEPD
ncbi:hypothetical protein PR048_005572 [Dryococelus australis]|uniref:Uncharacterized protein n=1 Tax=Dryococelus australis TaxID=614101 RepID=A0ABQ9I8M1_9NEOP|nr:hypothetical protein PR048_005572 [Dryococelus australis]